MANKIPSARVSVPGKPLFQGWLLSLTAAWILFGSTLVIAGYVLSWVGIFNRTGYAIALCVSFAAASWPILVAWRARSIHRKIRITRYKRVFPILYLTCLSLAIVGGALYAPSNYDALCYRIPRMLYWLQEGSYHWIEGFCSRMNFSSLGFEWLMLPGLAIFKTLRIAFLINAFSYVLMPGLIYLTMRRLGVRGAVASTWMWIIPCGSCFAMQAGSIGNDITATIYLLAAIVFSLKAKDSGSRVHFALAMLATGLCTCAKASNLPLLLPIGICFLVALANRPRLIPSGVCVGLVALAVSYAPLAVMNLRETGDWTGNPNSVQNMKNPLSGLAGNSLQIGVASLSPAVFPPARACNQWINDMQRMPPLNLIQKDFPELALGTSEMASEEGSGLGLGVTGAMMLALLGSLKSFRVPSSKTIGIWVAVAFLISLVTIMAKLGNPSVPRIIACYYPVAMILPLLLFDQRRIVRSRIWKCASIVLLIPIVPALAFNPARPLLRLDRIAEQLGVNKDSRLMERLTTVYNVYSERSDGHAAIRKLLPPSTRNVGFAGTDGDSSYSFWLPLGSRHVRDLMLVNGDKIPSVQGLDAIVTSEWGADDRYGITPEILAEKIGWRVHAKVPIRRMANSSSGGDMNWYVLLPPDLD